MVIHYFSSDLISAGMSDDDLTLVRDSCKDIRGRWKIAESYWRAAEFTGYERSLSIAARDLYGIDRIDETTIEKLNQLFQEARIRGGHYNFVLQKKSGIALSICDYMSVPHYDTDDIFAIAMRVNNFICPADDNRLVYQINTGLQEGNGNLIYDSNPVLLSNLFLKYRNARFDILHLGYPYIMELGVLAKNFRNVFIDMCWGHIISPEAASHALVEWLDIVPANKISAFGGDYRFVDGVYGHQYLARQNVTRALAQKVTEGSFSLARAREIASWVLFENPKRLFGLERLL